MMWRNIIFAVVVNFMLSFQAGAVVILDQNFTSTTNQGAQVGLTYDGLAQTFTVGVDGLFDSAELLLSHANPSPTGDLTISLFDTSGGAPNSVLASVSIAAGDISSTPGLYLPVLVDFSFANYAVSVGDVLAIGISSLDSGYAWNAGVDQYATYTGGQRYHDFDGGDVTWSALSSWDFSLKTYVATAVPEPSSLALIGLGLFGLGFVRLRKIH